jgi:hypothetical protein
MGFEENPKHADDAWIEKYRSALEQVEPQPTPYEKLMAFVTEVRSKMARWVPTAPAAEGDSADAPVTCEPRPRSQTLADAPEKHWLTRAKRRMRPVSPANSRPESFRNAG